MTSYVLLMRGNWSEMPQLSPEEMQQQLQQFQAWTGSLVAAGKFKGAGQLKPGGVTVRNKDGSITTDGPFAETKESIGGYFLIEAADLDDAAAVAKDCPILAYGGFVDIREE